MCPVAGPMVGPVPGAGRAKILRHICVRPGFGKRVGRWRVSGGRLRVVPFSTGVSRVTLVSFSLRLRFSWVTKVVDLLFCPFLQRLLEPLLLVGSSCQLQFDRSCLRSRTTIYSKPDITCLGTVTS